MNKYELSWFFEILTTLICIAYLIWFIPEHNDMCSWVHYLQLDSRSCRNDNCNVYKVVVDLVIRFYSTSWVLVCSFRSFQFDLRLQLRRLRRSVKTLLTNKHDGLQKINVKTVKNSHSIGQLNLINIKII